MIKEKRTIKSLKKCNELLPSFIHHYVILGTSTQSLVSRVGSFVAWVVCILRFALKCSYLYWSWRLEIGFLMDGSITWFRVDSKSILWHCLCIFLVIFAMLPCFYHGCFFCHIVVLASAGTRGGTHKSGGEVDFPILQSLLLSTLNIQHMPRMFHEFGLRAY